jgi:hypothetical protein
MRLAIAVVAISVPTLLATGAEAQARNAGAEGAPLLAQGAPYGQGYAPPTAYPPGQGYVAPYAPGSAPPPAVYVQPQGWRDPGVFASNTRGRMNAIEQDTRMRISRGWVSPQAMNVLRQRHYEVEQVLRRTAAAGVVRPAQQRYVDGLLREMQDVNRQFALRPYGRYPGYGGGPVPPGSYYRY